MKDNKLKPGKPQEEIDPLEEKSKTSTTDEKKETPHTEEKQNTNKDKEENSLFSSILDRPKEAWESGIKVLHGIDVIIPVKLLLVCNHISDKVREDEFSILTSISERDESTLTLSKGFYIPKQRVTQHSIDYLPDQYSFNTVIHRHPDGMNTFSSTDREYINQNFELSILYTKAEGFVHGVFNLKHDDYLIQLPIAIYIDYGLRNIDLSNIERESFLTSFKKERRPRRQGKSWDLTRLDTASENKNEADSGLGLFSSEPDKEKLLPEENLDYAMMKDLLLEDVNMQMEDMDYRLTSLEEAITYGRLSEGL